MKYKVPGVYLSPETEHVTPISISRQCLAAFIGIAEKGPLHKEVRLSSFQQYQQIFGGFSEYGNLPYAVYGFFNSGGTECVVVRTAHISDDENDQYAIKEGSLVIPDVNGDVAYRLSARTAGSWGNRITVRLWYKISKSSRIMDDVVENSYSIRVEDPSHYSPGDHVEIRSPEKCEYNQIRMVEGKTLYFSKPFLKYFNNSTGNVVCNLCTVNIILQYGHVFEEYYICSAKSDSDSYFVNKINEISQLVRIDEIRPGSLPSELNNRTLVDGRNGILNITPGDFIGYYRGLDDKKGLGIFEAIDEIAVISIPDVVIFQDIVYYDKSQALNDIFTVQKAVIDQCERLRNRFAILDMPFLSDSQEIIQWVNRFDSDHAAMYFPQIEIINPADSTGLSSIVIPPSGHICGVFSESDHLEGKHRAPANKFIKGAVGVSYMLENDEYELYYPHGLNNLRYVPGRGIKIWGARTLSSDQEWRYINVRRAMSAICKSIELGTSWAVFESNDSNLQKRIIRHITAFLLNLFNEGYFAGDEPEDAFYIRCDDELNPPDNIDNGIITIEVGIAIARPAEFLIITLKTDLDNQALSTTA